MFVVSDRRQSLRPHCEASIPSEHQKLGRMVSLWPCVYKHSTPDGVGMGIERSRVSVAGGRLHMPGQTDCIPGPSFDHTREESRGSKSQSSEYQAIDDKLCALKVQRGRLGNWSWSSGSIKTLMANPAGSVLVFSFL